MSAGYIRVLLVMQTTILLASMAPNNSVPQYPLFHLESSSRMIYNLTNLVYQYYLTCGQEYICDKTHFAFIKPYEAINSSIELCPSCQCDEGCVQRRDCCPDVLFAFPESECIPTSVFPFDINGNYMITTCHDQASSELKTKCEMNYTNAELIQTPPVTSKKYAHTFRNKFCAECNGVYAYDIWTIDISCSRFTDFNFLSSYDEIVNLAIERACRLTFKIGEDDRKHECFIADFPHYDYTPTFPDYDYTPPLPDYDYSPPLSDHNYTPPLPDYHFSPPLPDYNDTPPLPDYDYSPSLPDYDYALPLPDYDYSPPLPDYNYTPPLPDDDYSPPLPDYDYAPPLPDYDYAPPLPDYDYSPPLPDYNYTPPLPDDDYSPPLPDYDYAPPLPDYDYSPPLPDYDYTSPIQDYDFTLPFPDNDYTPPKMCNLTGTWENFDQDIETACMSSYYKSPNIFCDLCNPPETEPGLISTCNASGIWSPYDSALEDSCTKLGYTRNSVPYKNVFCFLCNRNNTNKYSYYDARIKLQRYLGTRTSNQYFIELQGYNMEFYHTVLKEYKTAHVFRNEKMSHETPWNISKLMMYHYAFYGHQFYCSSEFASEFNFEHSFCYCNSSCLFRSEPPFCCVDFVLHSPTSCFSNLVSGDNYTPTFYGAVDKCAIVSTDYRIRQRCENSSEDIFGLLPVTYENTIYKNFDCLMCNMDPTSVEHLKLTWKLHLDCVSDLNIEYRLKVYDIVTAAKYKGCTVTVQADHNWDPVIQMSQTYCSSNHLINTCNVSGLWSVYDQDILTACESWGQFLPQYIYYKNLFCYLCNNPIVSSENGISKDCTVPEENQFYGKSVTDACDFFPAVPGIGGYKNIFCDVCSNVNKTISHPSEWRPMIFTAIKPAVLPSPREASVQMLRELFLPSQYRAEIQIIEVNTSNNEIHDIMNNKVRNLTCYPGKLFEVDKCKPLLKITNNLRYTLAFVLEGESMSNSTTLQDITAYLQDKLMNILGTVKFDSFLALMNVSCEHEYPTHTRNESAGVRILVHTSFLVESNVDRLLIEEKLLNMTETEYKIVNRTYRSQLAPDAFVLPSLISSFTFVKQCSFINFYDRRMLSHEFNRPATVSKILLCRHVIFNKNEFTKDEHNLKISVLHSSRKFHQGEYLLINDTVRICIEDFKEIYSANETQGKSHQQPKINKALALTTFVCTILSLICLCLTFITYCLFRAMRSIPGINNMNLVFVMFFAQLLFQFGFTRTSVHNLCVTIGILIHFFWLAAFACMNICSFYMYNLFVVDMMAVRVSHQWKRRIFTYMLYSYGIPALIVILNIIVDFSTSQDGDVGYGYTRCFINKVASFYVSFLAPVLIFCISNIYFFVRTAIQLKSARKIESTKRKKNQFVIYVKLFSLTGITWILLVIDTLFPITVFSFLVTIATACHGLFVFVSFVLNKRVIKYYSALFCKKKSGKTTSSPSKKSSLENTQQSLKVTSSSV